MDPGRTATRVALVLICVAAALAVVIPVGLHWDFANFYDTGQRVAKGLPQDIYHPERLIEGRRPLGTLLFYGTPISAYFYWPLALMRPETALIVFKLMGVAAYAAALRILYQAIGRPRVLVLAALLFLPFWTIYRVGGQTTPFVLLLLVAGMVRYARKQFDWAAAWWVLAVLIKPGLLPALGFLVLVSGWRFFWASALLGSLAAVVSVASMGLPIHVEFVQLLRMKAPVVLPWNLNSSIYVITGGGMKALALRALIVASFAYFGWKVRQAALPARYVLCLLFAVLFPSTLWIHYLTWLFVVLLVVAADWDSLSPALRRLVLATFLVAAPQNMPLSFFLKDHLDLLGPLWALWKAGPLLLAWWMMLWHYDEMTAAASRNVMRDAAPVLPQAV